MQKPGGTDWARPESGLSISIRRRIVEAERDAESFSLQSVAVELRQQDYKTTRTNLILLVYNSSLVIYRFAM